MTSTSAVSSSKGLDQISGASGQVFSFPASFAQRRLWFLDQLTPGDVTYNVAGAVEIEGPLDATALERSLQEIVRRHESLRTRFEGQKGEARQVIYPEAHQKFALHDLSSLPEQERRQKAEQLTRQESQAPFDLMRGPLFRTSLLRLGDQLHWLLITMHHIVSDGWSVGVLVRELATLYGAFAQGQSSPLPDLPIQYVDYTAWQQEQLSGENLQSQIEYWKQQLKGSPAGLDIVTDHPRTGIQSSRGMQKMVQIEAKLARALRLFAQEQGATLYMVLLAGFQTLLSRYSGQQEILVGSPIAGRTRKETQWLIGFFVNTLVMKARVTEGITFRELLRQVKDTTLEAYAHQELPFEKLVEELSPERNLGRTPFFQTMFVLQNAPMPVLQLGSAKLRSLDLENETAKFEMTLALGESEDQLRGTLEYNTDIFDAATMERFFQHYTFLLEVLVSDPDRPVAQAPLMDEEERSRLALGWKSQLTADVPADTRKTLTALIADHASQEGKLALVAAGRQFTYQELDQKTSQIASYLHAQKVQPGAHVAICVSEGWPTVAAILGVLKAGAVAVPISAEDPIQRIESIVKDSGAALAVTEEKFAELLQHPGVVQIHLEGGVAPEGQPEFEHKINDAKTEALLIYQSGSAGKPEGVRIPHSGLLPRAFAGAANILPTDRVAQRIRAGHEENGILELLRCLAVGAAVVQIDSDGTPRKWASTVREQKATVLRARGPEIERLAREFASTLKSVRTALCEDEGPILQRLVENLGDDVLSRVYCAYGMNETCGWCALFPLAQWKNGIAGHLAAGVKLELLDKEMDPLPESIVGEIYIGGELLALGYHGLAGRTKAAFVLDEYSEKRHNRIYRSGDTGWRRTDGKLELSGRGNARAWISGVRVEATEVEAALNGCEGLQDVAVLVSYDGVTAFTVTNDGKDAELDKLQAWARPKIPANMIPRTLYRVESIPRNEEGAVDRLKLKSMAEQLENSSRVAAPYAPPESEVEKKLVVIMQKTLGLERVGINDDFFRIGGHSLLATQVVGQISHELGAELPLRRFFEAPTVAQLAQVVTELSNTAEAKPGAIPQIKRIARVAVQPQTIAK